MNRRKLLQSVFAIGVVGVALKNTKKVAPKKECPDTELDWHTIADKVFTEWVSCDGYHIDYSKDAMHL